MSCSPEGDLKFGISMKKGQQLKYFGIGSDHTTGNLRAIPSGVLNSLENSPHEKPLLILMGYTESTPNIQTPSTRRDLHILLYQQ